MPKVLTAQSDIQCAHAGGVKPVASGAKLKVGGAPVLLQGDLDSAPIPPPTLCATVPDPNTSTIKCTATTSALGGVATKLKVGGKGVLLETVQGMTNGTVGGPAVFQTWRVVSAGQTKLEAK